MSFRIIRVALIALLCASGLAVAGYGVSSLFREHPFDLPRAYTIANGRLYVIEKNNRLLEIEMRESRDALKLVRASRVAPDDGDCYYTPRKLYPGASGVVVNSYIYEKKTERFLGYRVQEYSGPDAAPKEILKVYFDTPGRFPELRYAAGKNGEHYFCNECEGFRNIWKVPPQGGAEIRGKEMRGVEELGEVNPPLPSLTSICLAPDGRIYLASGAEGTIIEYSSRGERLRAIGEVGFESGQLLAPDDLAFLPFDGESRLTVSATGNRTWVVFDSTGGVFRVISPLEHGYPRRDVLVGRPNAFGPGGAFYAFDLVNRLLFDISQPSKTFGGYLPTCSARQCRTIALGLLLLAVGLLYWRVIPLAERAKLPLFLKLLMLFVPLLLATAFIVGDQVKIIMKAELEEESLKRSKNLAGAALNAISLDDLQAVQSPADREGPAYKRIYSAVSGIIESDKVPDTPKWILHKIKDNRFYFGVNVWRGAIYEPYIVPEERRMFFDVLEKKEIMHGRFSDEQGEWFSYLVPITNETGKVIYVMELYRRAEQIDRADDDVTERILKAVGATSAVTIVLVFLFSFVTTRPIRRLMDAAARVGGGDFDHQIVINARDETRGLAEAFNGMTLALKSYTADLARATAEKERFQTELRFAREVQQGMLPKMFPPCDGMENVEIEARISPAKEVGGDYYDFFLVDDRHIGVVIADVAGKGVPAGLFMSATRTLLRSHAAGNVGAAKALARVNRMMAADNPSAMFVTMFYFTCDMRTGLVRYCNAGHNPPALIKAEAFEPIRLQSGPGKFPPIGAVEDARYSDSELRLRLGDSLFLYTDGVTEACDGKGAFFGTDVMIETLASARETTNAEKAMRLEQRIMRFQSDAEQADDMTMLFFKLTSAEMDAVAL